MIRAGKLDRTITIERQTTTLDANRAPVSTWTPIATVRAELVETATEEIIMAHGADAPTATVFRLRYIEGVTVADRVIFEGVVHDLKGATEIGRRRGLELRTVARP